MLFVGICTSRNNRAAGPANGQLIGNLAPDFELQTLDGKNLKLSGLRGKLQASAPAAALQPVAAAPAHNRLP